VLRYVYASVCTLLALGVFGVSLYNGIVSAYPVVPFIILALLVLALAPFVRAFEGYGMRVQYRNDEDDGDEQPKPPPHEP
jgi:hypothetical protein